MNNYLTPREYLPHEPPMVLIDEVIYVDDNKAVTRCYVNRNGVLSPFLNENGDLPAFFALEIFAQSVGVWNGYMQKESKNKIKIGMLLGTRNFKIKSTFFKIGTEITTIVQQNMSDGTLANFEGKIFLNKKEESMSEEQDAFASVRINVISLSDQLAYDLFTR